MSTAVEHTLCVVGAGPAGLAAAEVLAEAGHPVTVYERMPSPGRRLLMAGRGGLNLTHSEPLADFLARYHPAGSLEAAIRAFPPQALRDWCEGLGEPTFVGSSGRVFPERFKASPLLRAWLRRLETGGVTIRTQHRLVGITEGALIFETPEGTVRHRARAAVLALGGASWPRLGADGSWVGLLEGLGIPVSPLRPANGGFRIPWTPAFRERFAGTPVKRIALSVEGRRVRGEMVVTETGIEGGAVYALGRELRVAAETGGRLHLDLRPDLDAAALAQRLAGTRPGESLANRLRKAAGLAPVAAGLLREAAGGHLPGEAAALAALIKAVPLAIGAPESLARAISTAGGIAQGGLDARLMLTASPGLFAAGEMLDWEAPTGGYLLQGAFASGRAAAMGLLDWLGETGDAA